MVFTTTPETMSGNKFEALGSDDSEAEELQVNNHNNQPLEVSRDNQIFTESPSEF